jgi:hypothetical protein
VCGDEAERERKDRNALAALLCGVHGWRYVELRSHAHGDHSSRPGQVQHASKFLIFCQGILSSHITYFVFLFAKGFVPEERKVKLSED